MEKSASSTWLDNGKEKGVEKGKGEIEEDERAEGTERVGRGGW